MKLYLLFNKIGKLATVYTGKLKDFNRSEIAIGDIREYPVPVFATYVADRGSLQAARELIGGKKEGVLYLPTHLTRVVDLNEELTW